MEREYLAYISYRHTPVDKEAAITIQRQLEHYRIPKIMRKDGNVHLGTVFRDTDELNISPDLSQSLCEALDNSEYLIVLCSPEYKASEWCRQEIVYFLEHHDIDHVLPVLVNGNPCDAFPEEIILRSVVDGEDVFSEPLAANVSGETITEMKQKVKKEYLRLVAKMLGCDYDELVQRQKRYERKRLTAVIGAALAVLLAFIVMLLIKNAQVNSRYQEMRQSQAQYLSKLALEQYAQGDSKSALESVLKILPEGKETGPVVPEQMYALSTVLNAYNNSYVPENFIPLPEHAQKVFSDDACLLFSYLDDSLNVYDTSTGKVCYSFELHTFLKNNPELAEEHPGLDRYVQIDSVTPADNEKFFISLSGNIFEFDITDPSYYRFIVCAENSSSLHSVCYAKGKLAFCPRSGPLQVYDCESGKMLYEKDFNENSEDTSVTYSVQDLAWNEDAGLLAVGLNYSNKEIRPSAFDTGNEFKRQEEEYFRNNPPLGLVLIDPASGELTKLSSLRTASVSFAGNVVGAAHKEYPPYSIKYQDIWIEDTARWFAGIYDVSSGVCVYQSEALIGEAYNCFGLSQGTIKDNGKAMPVYSMWFGKTGIVFDAASRDVPYIESYRADVIGMNYLRDSLVTLILSNGSIQIMTISECDALRTNVMKLDIVVDEALQSGEQYYLLTDSGMIQCGLSKWEDTTYVTSSEADLKDYDATVFRYFETEQGMLRLVGYEAPTESRLVESFSALEVYPCLSDKALFSFVSDDPAGSIEACTISKDGNHIYILEKKSTGDVLVSGYNVSDGTTEFSSSLPSELTYNGILSDVESSGFSEDGNMLWITEYNRVHFYDLNSNIVCRAEYQFDNRIKYPVLTENGCYLAWMEKASESDGNYLVLLEPETGETEKFELPENFVLSNYSCVLLPGQNGTVIAYDGGTEVYVFDTEKDRTFEAVPVSAGSKISLMGNKTELLTAHEYTVSLYDLRTGECESQLELEYMPVAFFTDSSSEIFAVDLNRIYTSANDNGWFLGGQYLISVDEERNMYLMSFIKAVSTDQAISPVGGEIIAGDSSGSFAYKRIQSFEQLVASAQSK